MHGQRTCQACYVQEDSSKACQREKYVFLVRHAQSTWNQNVEMVKNIPRVSFHATSLKKVVSQAHSLLAHEMWQKDHPLSAEGAQQTEALRQKIKAQRMRQGFEPQSEREQRYYDSFFSLQKQIYCSPLRRALQTACLALPEQDGWGAITLLKDARERFSFVFERDCLGEEVGGHIVDGAVKMGQEMGQELPGIRQRVDATDCAQQWWNEQPETEAEVDVRLHALWRRILVEDCHDSCVLVTHSNLIKALLMRFGGLDEEEEDRRQESGVEHDGEASAVGVGLSSQVTEPPSAASSCTLASGRAAGDRKGVQDAAQGATSGGNAALNRDRNDASGDDEDRGAGPADAWEIEERRASRCWQVVDGGSESLRRLKVERLQNCGVLGLRCVLEEPAPRHPYEEVDGWVDLDTQGRPAETEAAARQRAAETRWVAKDALLMFDSVLVS